MPGTVKTTRLRKCECAGCGYVARISRTWLSRGLPGCPCGGRLVPTDLDDVLAAADAGHVTDAELGRHDEYVTYLRELHSIEHGRAGKGAKWGTLAQTQAKTKDGRMSDAELALARVRAARDLAAHDARHAALKAHAFGGPKTEDPIPF
jgi:hypothetical protein